MSSDEKDDYEEPAPAESADIEQEESAPAEPQATNEIDDDPIRWTASEYIHVEKNALWYILFIVVVLGLIAVDVFILKSYTFSALVIVMAVALVIYSRRPPRTMQYALSDQHGLYIGDHLHSFSEFKAFGLIKDGDHHSIMLIPVKRFAPGVSVYFPEEAGEEIVDILGARLPMKPLKLDLIDVIVRQLRL
jgi:hypothetical protein